MPEEEDLEEVASESDDGEGDAEESVLVTADAPSCVVKSPKNSLRIDKENSTAAFYPTAWHTDGFTTNTMSLELIRVNRLK